jgi:hypothetical protein
VKAHHGEEKELDAKSILWAFHNVRKIAII